MLTEEQLALRRTGIASSDIQRIVGESPFGGPCDVYADKVLDAKSEPPTIAQRIGNYLEPLVLELISEQFKIDVARSSATIQHPVWPWLMSTPDGIVGGSTPSAAAEAKVKTVLFHDRDLWLDDKATPPFVHIQSQWHMIARRVPVCYVGALLGSLPRFWVVENDDELAAALIESGQEFHERHVLPRVPPPPDGTEGARRMLQAVWPRARKAAALKASPDVEAIAREYFEAHNAEKMAKQAKENAAQELMQMAQDFERVNGDGWRLLRGTKAGYHVDAYDVAESRQFDLRKVNGK